jgi:hypothetical protein
MGKKRGLLLEKIMGMYSLSLRTSRKLNWTHAGSTPAILAFLLTGKSIRR